MSYFTIFLETMQSYSNYHLSTTSMLSSNNLTQKVIAIGYLRVVATLRTQCKFQWPLNSKLSVSPAKVYIKIRQQEGH